MDQHALIASLGAHLDALESLVNATMGLALIAGWAGWKGRESISILSAEFNREEAFYFLWAIFIVVNLAFALFMFRIGDIVHDVDKDHACEALSVLALHKWPFNPFSFFGTSASSIVYSSIGFGWLVLIWWVTNSVIYILKPKKSSVASGLMFYVYIGLGIVVASGSIYRVYAIGYRKLLPISPEMQVAMCLSMVLRGSFVVLGIACGMALFFCLGRRRGKTAVKAGSAKEGPRP